MPLACQKEEEEEEEEEEGEEEEELSLGGTKWWRFVPWRARLRARMGQTT